MVVVVPGVHKYHILQLTLFNMTYKNTLAAFQKEVLDFEKSTIANLQMIIDATKKFDSQTPNEESEVELKKKTDECRKEQKLLCESFRRSVENAEKYLSFRTIQNITNDPIARIESKFNEFERCCS
jgi:hypothetical protein